nr:lyase family protein [Ferruginibacter sp.]
GSSIMPHKKNPDVFELIRSHGNRLQALPNEIMLMTANLPSGYHRDLQLIKEHIIPAFENLQDCLRMTTFMLRQVNVKKNILQDEQYAALFSVEEVNKLVLQGMPFRDAYKKVGADIASGNFKPGTVIHHTHEGSIGNPGNEAIRRYMEDIIQNFNFNAVKIALQQLLS